MNRLLLIIVPLGLLFLAGCGQEDAETMTAAPPASSDAKVLPTRVGGKPSLGDPSGGKLGGGGPVGSTETKTGPATQ